MQINSLVLHLGSLGNSDCSPSQICLNWEEKQDKHTNVARASNIFMPMLISKDYETSTTVLKAFDEKTTKYCIISTGAKLIGSCS